MGSLGTNVVSLYAVKVNGHDLPINLNRMGLLFDILSSPHYNIVFPLL